MGSLLESGNIHIKVVDIPSPDNCCSFSMEKKQKKNNKFNFEGKNRLFGGRGLAFFCACTASSMMWVLPETNNNMQLLCHS